MSDTTIISAKDLARCLRMSRQTVYKHARAGHVAKVGRNQFDRDVSIERYIAHLRALTSRYENNDYRKLVKARRRKEVAEAEIKELEVAKLLGEFGRVDKMAEASSRIVDGVRSRMSAIPEIAGARLGITPEQKKCLKGLVDEVLETFADDVSNITPKRMK